MSKKSSFRRPFEKQHCKRSQTLLNLQGSTFIIFIDQCKGNWVEKNYFLVVFKVLRLFVNSLTADDRYSLVERENLTKTIQIYLSKKQKKCQVFLQFWNLDQILNILKKKMTLIVYIFRKIRTAKNVVR